MEKGGKNHWGEPYDPINRRSDFIQAGWESIRHEIAEGEPEQLRQELAEWRKELEHEAETAPPGAMKRADIMHLGTLPVIAGILDDLLEARQPGKKDSEAKLKLAA